LHFECTNNTTEYEACILGLEAALELKVRKIDVYGDSMLIICQVKGE
jgi:ribonuclease HI